MKMNFLLDPDVIFLNHGSFGATPRPVFTEYQRLQRELESQPVKFLARSYDGLMYQARSSLGTYLTADPDDIVLFPNTTFGINTVVPSLNLTPEDVVLTSNHEYGACNRTWQYYAENTGFTYQSIDIPTPVTSDDEIVEKFAAAISVNTKCIYLSHITSETAIIFPVSRICALAREAGILTVIDGAHAPGQIPLNLFQIDPDIYIGNCHKWLCAPKGSAFMYVRRQLQESIQPLIISWGWKSELAKESTFIDWHQWTGTRDPAAHLSIAKAISLREDWGWDEKIDDCHALLADTGAKLKELTGLPPTADSSHFRQMAAFTLPENIDLAKLKNILYEKFRIEVPVHRWNSQNLVRVSVQIYNTQQDCEALVSALRDLLE